MTLKSLVAGDANVRKINTFYPSFIIRSHRSWLKVTSLQLLKQNWILIMTIWEVRKNKLQICKSTITAHMIELDGQLVSCTSAEIMDIGSAIFDLKIFQKCLKISKKCKDVKDVKHLGRKFSLKPKITRNKNWAEHSVKTLPWKYQVTWANNWHTKMLLDNF